MMTFEAWRDEQLKQHPELRRSSTPFLRQMYEAYWKRQGGDAGGARAGELAVDELTIAVAEVIRWRPLRLQLAVSLACAVALAALDDETLSLRGLTHYAYMPAPALFAFVFLPITTVVRIAYYAYRERRTGAGDPTGLRPIRWLVLLLQLAASFSFALMLGLLDEGGGLSLRDVMVLENAPAMVIYTLVFFLITMLARFVMAEVATGVLSYRYPAADEETRERRGDPAR